MVILSAFLLMQLKKGFIGLPSEVIQFLPFLVAINVNIVNEALDFRTSTGDKVPQNSGLISKVIKFKLLYNKVFTENYKY